MNTMYYTVEKNQKGEFDVFQCDPPTARYCGKRIIATTKTHEECMQFIDQYLERGKEILRAVELHGAIGVGSKTV